MPNYFTEKEEKELVSYYTAQPDLMQLSKVGMNKENRKNAMLNGTSLSDMYKYLFVNGGWVNNLQNNMLVTLIYGCAGDNPYMDDVLISFIQKINQVRPDTRYAMNQMLKSFAESVEVYAPYNEKFASLAKYIDYCITSNNKVLAEEGEHVEEENFQDKINRHNKDEEFGLRFKEAKGIMIKNGWDFSRFPEDEEFLIQVFNLEKEGTVQGHQVYEEFLNTMLNAKVYNDVDRDNLYKNFQDFLRNTGVGEYANIKDIAHNVNALRESSKEDVEKTAKKTAQVTDLFPIITEINRTVNKRGNIEKQKGFAEGDDKFYNSFFINDTDFRNADVIFDEVFGKLIERQRALSDIAANMTDLDLIADCFKILKGNRPAMDIKTAVRERLINAGLYKDPDEAGILPDEKEERIAYNQKNMTTLAKAYILHEVQNKDTKLIFEPYLVNMKYKSTDPVAEYLDINHPKRIKLMDLDANKVQHDPAILEHYGEEAGMLYSDNYHNYVMGALANKMVIKVRDVNQRIGAYSIGEFKEALEEKGWKFNDNENSDFSPADQNYFIMLFNAYDPLSRGYQAIANAAEIMLSENVNGIYQKNEVLRKMYNELKDFRDDKTIDVICDYINADLQQTRILEASDKIKKTEPVQFYDTNVLISGMNFHELSSQMYSNGWSQYDNRMGELINRIYNAYAINSSSQPVNVNLKNALEFGVNVLSRILANVSAENMAAFYEDFRRQLSDTKSLEGADILDEYLSDLHKEAIAIIQDAKAKAEEEQQKFYAKEDNFSVSAGIYDNDVQEELIAKPGEDKGSIYGVSNLNIQNIATGNNNDIAINQGLANNNFNDNVNFNPETFVFEKDKPFEPVNYDIKFTYPEQEKFLRACADYKYIKAKYLEQLTEIKRELLSTKRQQGKEFGAEGTGSNYYRNMANTLEHAIKTLSSPNANEKQISDSLLRLKEYSQKYYDERWSAFGKRGEGNVRLTCASKAKEISDYYGIMLEIKFNELKETAKDVRININETVTEKGLTLDQAKLMDVNSEMEIPRPKDDVLEENMNVLKDKATILGKIRELGAGKENDYALKFVNKKYEDRLMSPSFKNEDRYKMARDVMQGKWKEEIAALKNNKVFMETAKKNPSNFISLWKNVSAKADSVSNESKAFVSSIIESKGSAANYVYNKEGDAPVNVDAACYDRLAKIAVENLLGEDVTYSQQLVLEAVGKKEKLDTGKENFIKMVSKHLQEENVLKDGINDNIINNEIQNNTLIKNAIKKMIAKKQTLSKNKNAEKKTVKIQEVKNPTRG